MTKPVLSVVAIVAVAALLVVGSRSSGGSGAEDATLPAYAVASAASATATQLDVTLRPASSVDERLAAWPFAVVDGDEEPSPLDARVELAKDGAIRIQGAAPARAREIRVVIAPAGATKYDEALAHARAGTSDARIRVVLVRVAR